MGARGGIGSPEALVSVFAQRSTQTERAGSAPAAWYDATWNPTGGCSAVSSGCERCEALQTVSQLARMGGKGGARYAGLTSIGHAGLRWTGEIRMRTDLSTWPLLQRTPRRILVDSMSDLFHEKLAIETIDALHAVMAVAHWHRFLVLTKRAERMRLYYADPQTPYRIAMAVDRMAVSVLPTLGSRSPIETEDAAPPMSRARSAGARQLWVAGLSRVVRRPADLRGGPNQVGLEPWPLPNLWLGVSVEDQDHMTRVGELLQTPAALRWACFEPLLGPVRPDAVPVGEGYIDALAGGRYLLDGRGRRVPGTGPAFLPLDWVIAGGETGTGARSADPDWVRGLRDRCAMAGVPFWFKQWGEWAPDLEDELGRRMVRRRRSAAGRLVDGRCWNEMPARMNEGVDRRR